MKIEEGKEFRMENVLSLRKKMTHQQIKEEMMKMNLLLAQEGAKLNGYVVTTTYNYEQKKKINYIDMEILIPLDKVINVREPYCLKKVFLIANAALYRYCGNPQFMNNDINIFLKNLKLQGLEVITPLYNVQIKNPVDEHDYENMIVDNYIGINPNIL